MLFQQDISFRNVCVRGTQESTLYLNYCQSSTSELLRQCQLANIRITYKYIDKELFSKLISPYIRPKIEQTSQLWSPYLQKHEILLKVQRKATETVTEFKELSYSERLAALDLPSVEQRRVRGDLTANFMCLNQSDDVNREILREMMTTRSKARNLLERISALLVSVWWMKGINSDEILIAGGIRSLQS